MISTLRSLTQQVSQVYRSTQAFSALRSLRRATADGKQIVGSRSLTRLASAMSVDADTAHDVFLSTLCRTSSAVDIVNVHKTLEKAKYLTPLFPDTGRHVKLLAAHACAVRVSAITDTVKLSQRANQNRLKAVSARRKAEARGLKGITAYAGGKQLFWTKTLSQLTDEVEILADGLG